MAASQYHAQITAGEKSYVVDVVQMFDAGFTFRVMENGRFVNVGLIPKISPTPRDALFAGMQHVVVGMPSGVTTPEMSVEERLARIEKIVAQADVIRDGRELTSEDALRNEKNQREFRHAGLDNLGSQGSDQG